MPNLAAFTLPILEATRLPNLAVFNFLIWKFFLIRQSLTSEIGSFSKLGSLFFWREGLRYCHLKSIDPPPGTAFIMYSCRLEVVHPPTAQNFMVNAAPAKVLYF